MDFSGIRHRSAKDAVLIRLRDFPFLPLPSDLLSLRNSLSDKSIPLPLLIKSFPKCFLVPSLSFYCPPSSVRYSFPPPHFILLSPSFLAFYAVQSLPKPPELAPVRIPYCPVYSRVIRRPDGEPRKCLPHQLNLCLNALDDRSLVQSSNGD